MEEEKDADYYYRQAKESYEKAKMFFLPSRRDIKVMYLGSLFYGATAGGIVTLVAYLFHIPLIVILGLALITFLMVFLLLCVLISPYLKDAEYLCCRLEEELSEYEKTNPVPVIVKETERKKIQERLEV